MAIWILCVFGALLLIGILACCVASIRMSVLTPVIFAWFKSVLPPMSETEQEAIAAGDVWHEANLFQGRPQWQRLLADPKPSLSVTEQNFIDNQVTELCGMLDEWQATHKDFDVPSKVWNFMKTAGFFGLHIPQVYGGLEFSTLASSTIVQKIATKSLSSAVTVMVPNSLGPAELILHYGTQAQKDRYLHNLAKGVEIPCFALTAPDAGSDATSITDEGVVCYAEGSGTQRVLGIRLKFSKRYITLAPVATLIGLAVKLRDPDKILSEKVELGITVVLVPRDTQGLEIGHRHFPLNQAFMNGPIRGKDVFLPLDSIIGGTAMIGHGWKMLVECLAAGRGISLPALSTATAKHCFRTTGAYAKLRKQFNMSIGRFEGVAAALARIGGYTYMLEATRVFTLGALDRKFKPSVATAICKYHMTEMARVIINDAMDIHGGRGIMLGSRNYLGRMYQGMPISITVEGANILTRSLIIFGQGAIRCHPYVLREITAINNPDNTRGLKEFDSAIWRHVCYTFANFSKLKLHSYTAARFCEAPSNTRWRRYYQRFSFFSLALACCSDLAMLVLGGGLKRKENLSARLGDILSYLYIASAVLKYDHDHGEQAADQPFAQWALDYCLYQIQQQLTYFLLNFPLAWLAKPLLWLILPPWRNFRLPSDNLGLNLSSNMMQASEFRERLTANCVPSGIEQAWLMMLETEPLLARIDTAVRHGDIAKNADFSDKIKAALELKLINNLDAEKLNTYEKLRWDAIQVDEFTNAELIGK